MIDDYSETMLAGMAPALFLGQCFSLLGVSNVAGKNGKKPEFRWLSFRMLYSFTVSALLLMNTIMALSDLLYRGDITLSSSQVIAFYLSSLAASCLYVRLAVRWSSLCCAFEQMEKRISFYGSSKGLKRRMRFLTAVVLILALSNFHCQQSSFF